MRMLRFSLAFLAAILLEVLLAWLGDGRPSEAQVAELLDVSRRTLQRRLRSHGTCYRELLEATLRMLAERDLADPDRWRIATACYLIDALCLRVGDEKDPDEADSQEWQNHPQCPSPAGHPEHGSPLGVVDRRVEYAVPVVIEPLVEAAAGMVDVPFRTGSALQAPMMNAA